MGFKINGYIIGGVFMVAISAFCGVKLYEKWKPNEEVMSLYDYYDMTEAKDSTSAKLIIGTHLSTNDIMIDNSVKYMDYEMAKRLNDRIFIDEEKSMFIFTTPTEVIKIPVDSTSYTVNGESQTASAPILKKVDDIYYIDMAFVEKYSDFTYESFDSPNRVLIKYNTGEDSLIGTCKDGATVRFMSDKKSKILEKIGNNEKVIIDTVGTDTSTGYTKVVTTDGVIGYVKDSEITKSDYEKYSNPNYTASEYTSIHKDFVSLAWASLTNQKANSNGAAKVKNVKGVNVISPTWMTVAGENGEVSEWCSNDYVKAVHNAGMDVWIVVNDLEPNTKTANVLKDTDKRETLEKNIVNKVKEYNAEGVNVDFECVTVESSPYYIQFIRELSVLCRKEKLVLSVDSYVSMPYNAFYYRDKVAEVADYVVIMGYDEHHSNSEEIGSNASISWTKKGIDNSIADGVPKEKLVVTIPLYARLFGTPEGEEGFTDCISYDMNEQQTLIKEENLTPTWDADAMQNFVLYGKDGKRWKMWMEDNKSIEEKLKVIKEAGIAGTGFWQLGYASSDVWDVVANYTK
ncbi:MAG: hypothetical protein K6G26_12185 [Lachnospiraceae bacterium]|nr:hypothetical protein [Lachnospiraceae bacterium]